MPFGVATPLLPWWLCGWEKDETGDGTGGGDDAGTGDDADDWRCNASRGLPLGGAPADGVDERRAADEADAECGGAEMRRASRVRKTSSASGGAAGVVVDEGVEGSGAVVVRPP